MSLFAKQGFNQGSWATRLRPLLLERRIINDKRKRAVTQRWRPTQTFWIQYEPVDLPKGPAFWLGKPAVQAWDGKLYAGYYIERGHVEYTKKSMDPYKLMDASWHWHSFLATLANPEQRHRLSELMRTLPEDQRCIGSRCWQDESKPIDHDSTSLDEMESVINGCGPNDWIDLMLGVSFTMDECLQLQDSIVNELRSPLIRAAGIDVLVLNQPVVITDT